MIHKKERTLRLSSQALNIIDAALEEMQLSCEDFGVHANVGAVLRIIRGTDENKDEGDYYKEACYESSWPCSKYRDNNRRKE